MKKKKILAVLVAASTLASFTACGGMQEKTTENLSANEKSETLEEQTKASANSSSGEEPVNDTDKNKKEKKTINKKEKKTANKKKRKSDTKNNKKNEPETSQSANETSEDIRPEFKEVLDSYEAYMDEYCSFMKKYTDSDNDSSMLAEYYQMMIKYAQFAERIEALKDEEMNDAEANYYIKVTLKVSQKLLEASK